MDTNQIQLAKSATDKRKINLLKNLRNGKMTGRNRKETADYFSHDADASSDEKVVYIESLFGHKGYAVYFKFLERMTRSDNFEIDWNDIKKAIYASEFKVSVTEIEQIITECCRQEIKAFQIKDEKLFSVGLRKRMQPLLEKRNYNRLKYKEKKEASISVTETTQRKGKERKGKDSKVEDKRDSLPPCPQKEIIKLYNEILPSLPAIDIETWPKSSQKQLRMRWREDPKRQCLENWQKFFKYIKKSEFLMGNNDRGWTADLFWLVGPKNFAKVLSGKYHNNQQENLAPYEEFING